VPAIAMDKEIKENMQNYYLQKNMNPSIPMRMVNTPNNLTMLPDVQLCIFVQSINITPNIFKLDINKYFTEKDIQLATDYKEKRLNKKENEIVFENVDQSRDNLWMCTKITFQQLAELAKRGLIGYNFRTQRNAKIIYKGKDMIKLPFVNKNSIDEMKESWKLGTFTPNTITFNLEHTCKENKPIYNSTNRTLGILLNEGEQLNVVDGYHRTLTGLYIIEDDPKFSTGFYYLRILNYTEQQAHDLILQEAKGTPISVQQMKFMNEQDINMIIAKDIDNYGLSKTNALHDKMTVNQKEITHGDKYVFYNTISDAIGYFFDTNDPDNRNRIENILLKGLNTIISINSSSFKHIIKTRKNSVETHNNMFIFYIGLLSRLYDLNYDIEINLEDKGRMEKTIKEILSSLDFNIENPIWKDLKIVSEKGEMLYRSYNLKDYNKLKSYVFSLIPVSNKEKEAVQ
jgi:hypothetical protein